jgi:hypothetical protein
VAALIDVLDQCEADVHYQDVPAGDGGRVYHIPDLESDDCRQTIAAAGLALSETHPRPEFAESAPWLPLRGLTLRMIAGMEEGVLANGQYSVRFGWNSLLALRGLVGWARATRPRWDTLAAGPWEVASGPSGIRLIWQGGAELALAWDDVEVLAGLLYVGDDLLTQTEAAELADTHQQQVYTAIARGDLFAFQLPGRRTRRHQVPRGAVQGWADGRCR